MFINLDENYAFDRFSERLNLLLDGPKANDKVRIRDGAYLIRHFNFGNSLGKGFEEYPLFTDSEISPYGVVDTPDQFFEFFGDELERSPREFVVSFTEIRREDQPSSDGWRYHKWGDYYGSQNPEHEYLHDDEHIDAVFCFHIYERKTDAPRSLLPDGETA